MFGFIVDAAMLFLIMFIVARHDADLTYWKVIVFVFAISILAFAISLIPFGGVIAPFIIFGTLAWGLVQFFYVSWKQALIIAGIFFAISIAIDISWSLISSS